MSDERTDFGRALSSWVIKHKDRAESVADVAGSLVGTAAAEHIYAGHTREQFLEICARGFDDIKKAFDEMKS